MRRRERVGLTALMDVARLTGPPEPGISALCSARASMPAAASAAPISARGCCSRRTRRGGRDRRRARPAQPRAPGDRARDRRGGRGRGDGGARPRGERRRGGHRRRGWHPGVVGLVAARLKERFGRPAFAIALEPGGIGTGSGRSIPGVDLGRAVRRAVAGGLDRQGRRPCHGGRRDACAKTRSAPFRAFLEDDARAAVAAARRATALLIDGAISGARRQRRSCCACSPRRSVRRRQSGAGDRAAGAYPRLCGRGRPSPCARPAQVRRRRGRQRHRVPRRRPEARRGAAAKPRPQVHVAGSLALDRWKARSACNSG